MTTADRAMPAFADLYLLTSLAELRSFTQAARRLGISKASVSMRIAELERAAGLPLVRRTTRSVVLTEAGQRLADDTRAAFERISQSFSEVKDLAGTPRGLVRITAPVALGRQVVAPRLAAFFRRFPEIRIELDLSDRFVNLAQEGFDLAIRHTQAPPDTHVAWLLCETRSILAASRDYLRERGEPAHPAELAAHRCLLYTRDQSAYAWSFERRASGRSRRAAPERVSVPVAGPLRANNSEVLRELVADGAGIALLPDFTAAADIRKGELVQVLEDWEPVGFFGSGVYALRPWSPQVPRAVQCLVDYLRESLAAGFALEGEGTRKV